MHHLFTSESQTLQEDQSGKITDLLSYSQFTDEH